MCRKDGTRTSEWYETKSKAEVMCIVAVAVRRHVTCGTAVEEVN